MPGVITEFHAHGFALARVVDTEAELLMIVTETIKQNTGLATNCLLNIEKKLIQQGAQKLTLEVSESNSAAITIYTKLNYKKIAIRKSYSRDKNGKFETALVMQKDLRQINLIFTILGLTNEIIWLTISENLVLIKI